MFTVGHSLSLALAAMGWVNLPGRWVEVAIAATIFVAAGYALHPRLSTRAEVAVTGTFGLIHGFGFAGTLAELSLHGRDLAVPLLAFNVGLETAQLAALALVVVPLFVLARSTTASRIFAACVALVAGGWVVERTWGTTVPFESVATTALASPERLAMVVALAAVAVLTSASWKSLVRVRAQRPQSSMHPTHWADHRGLRR